MTNSEMKIPRRYQETAQEHADGDARCGRKWQCACGACRIARREKFKPWTAGELAANRSRRKLELKQEAPVGWLREARVALGLTQLELARALDVTPSMVSRWETGSKPIGHATMLKLAVEHLACMRPPDVGVWEPKRACPACGTNGKHYCHAVAGLKGETALRD